MVDKEKLRPAFEAWYSEQYEIEPTRDEVTGDYALTAARRQWASWCAAIDSLGTPIATFTCRAQGASTLYLTADGAMSRAGVYPLYALPRCA